MLGTSAIVGRSDIRAPFARADARCVCQPVSMRYRSGMSLTGAPRRAWLLASVRQLLAEVHKFMRSVESRVCTS